MGTNYRDFDDVVYVAGVTFQSEYGTHEAGTVVKEATSFQNLDVLVDNRFLYPIAPQHGYEYLPQNLFNHIGTREEVMAKLTGAPMNNPEQYENGEKPEVVKQAEREAEQRLTEKTSKEAKAQAAKANEDTAKRAADLATPDANPAYQDKAADLKKMYKGDKEAFEVMADQVEAHEEQAEEAAEETAKAVNKESTGLVTKSGNESKSTKSKKE